MKYPTTARPDVPDNRDWIYQAQLINSKPMINIPENALILNQHSEGACTGFALAAAINYISKQNNKDFQASARMLYEMAKRHDEWEGEEYSGSSLRGALYGWKHMGVCHNDSWPYFTDPARRGNLSIVAAKEARSTNLGAYYRIRPVISDYHAALNETGVIIASALTHGGWQHPSNGKIELEHDQGGGHAFAIVGYNESGFFMQNSWGSQWGNQGFALWTYEDWIENVMDAWVFQLALSTPQIFGLHAKHSLLTPNISIENEKINLKTSITRSQIAGHFVHINDGDFASGHRYWSTIEDVKETAQLVRDSHKYDHVLFYGHGGLNTPNDSAARIFAMKEVFKANRIYPFHIMYNTGLIEELLDLIKNKAEKNQQRAAGFFDWLDHMFEKIARRPGTLIWNEMKNDAHRAFEAEAAGTASLQVFIEHLRESKNTKSIHLLGHSTGAILFAHLLSALSRYKLSIESCSLLAPACSIELFNQSYLPSLQGNKRLKLKNMAVYNLKDELERDDKVLSNLIYRKSLLYLVSNAFEPIEQQPLLGMEKFKSQVSEVEDQFNIHYSNGSSSSKTRSLSHGGFDNDSYTMNSVLRTILGDKKPSRLFKAEDLNY